MTPSHQRCIALKHLDAIKPKYIKGFLNSDDLRMLDFLICFSCAEQPKYA